MQISTRIPVPGTYNFRDVGGLPAADGIVRSGVLYRSDGLFRLGDDGRDHLRELGLSRVIDLRDEREAHAMPDDLDGLDLQVRRLPVFEGSGASQGAGGVSLEVLYERIVTQHSRVVVDAVRDISTADGAVLVHCTAGKDRTGVVVAMTLLAVGVDRDAVIADYERTEQNLAGEWLEGMIEMIGRYGVPDSPELRVLMGGSPPEAIESAIERVEREHGSARDYLLASGLALSELAGLEARLLERG
ncbi:tyrosine-protein phosphatase [Agromyces intestinalis]|uniref:Tyrosine-protein phosphatase n=1 Tax=Agromyces intestinalis TaxID=2592652 RepID=A0A5C1YHI1_9MICO|nr:tyrosine-protein phosphatase [Agromyces intestinalis]QEO15644.1 tyrosine-protein phosphatase [Agromyces intestinalis]